MVRRTRAGPGRRRSRRCSPAGEPAARRHDASSSSSTRARRARQRNRSTRTASEPRMSLSLSTTSRQRKPSSRHKGSRSSAPVNVVDEGVLAGWRWVYFADPDGYPLELVEVAYYNAEERRDGDRGLPRLAIVAGSSSPPRRVAERSAGRGHLESFLHDLVAARGGELGVVNAEIRGVRHGAVARFRVSQLGAAKEAAHVGMVTTRLGLVARAVRNVRAETACGSWTRVRGPTPCLGDRQRNRRQKYEMPRLMPSATCHIDTSPRGDLLAPAVPVARRRECADRV